MPIHTFRCKLGHTFEALTKMDLSDAPKVCPKVDQAESIVSGREFLCLREVERLISAPSGHFPGADSWRK